MTPKISPWFRADQSQPSKRNVAMNMKRKTSGSNYCLRIANEGLIRQPQQITSNQTPFVEEHNKQTHRKAE